MKKAVWLVTAIALMTALFGCNSKENKAMQGGTAQKSALPDPANDKELAIKFLKGVQNADKKAMYEAENLTDEMVNESREKLIHPAKYNLTEAQRTEFEHILRMSGGVDFFAKKLVLMFPKSATFQIEQTTVQGTTQDTRTSSHVVKITYNNRNEAMSDKTGRQVKEMTVPLKHIVRLINGRWIHEISFSSNDFEKIAVRDFAVKSYY